ncbi:hypothetical protein LCGC14_1812050 [marine sediment metagenome]|uniref:Uncharacterized protein n=1 Tax=marine sediment metagenome TaxID=412755 RepID=A0A0F9H9H1_9ZZZZ
MAEPRLQRIAHLQCTKCKNSPFSLFRRQNTQRDGSILQTWENILWPNEVGVVPPHNPRDIRCPHCDHQLRRQEV